MSNLSLSGDSWGFSLVTCVGQPAPALCKVWIFLYSFFLSFFLSFYHLVIHSRLKFTFLESFLLSFIFITVSSLSNPLLGFSSLWVNFVVQSLSCLTPCDSMDCSTPGFPVLHYLLELKLMSIESVMPSNHLILHPPLLRPSIFPASGSFSVSQLFTSGGQSIGASASASVLPMNIQGWFPYLILIT